MRHLSSLRESLLCCAALLGVFLLTGYDYSYNAEVQVEREVRVEKSAPDEEPPAEKSLPAGKETAAGKQVRGGEKGNTAALAEKIAARIGADTFEVVPADDGYPMDNYDKLTEMAKTEQAKKVRPQYAGPIPDPDAVRRRLHRSSGLVGRLTDEEFSDLIEYVLSL